MSNETEHGGGGGCGATPREELHERLMDPRIAKTELEHYARRKIIELEEHLSSVKEVKLSGGK